MQPKIVYLVHGFDLHYPTLLEEPPPGVEVNEQGTHYIHENRWHRIGMMSFHHRREANGFIGAYYDGCIEHSKAMLVHARQATAPIPPKAGFFHRRSVHEFALCSLWFLSPIVGSAVAGLWGVLAMGFAAYFATKRARRWHHVGSKMLSEERVFSWLRRRKERTA